jgi:putative oxidoreductase
MALDEIRTTWSPRILSVLRIMASLLLLQYGTAKLLGFPVLPYLNNVERFSLFWTAGLFEFFGGLLLLIGLFTRCVAFVLSGLMACAYFIYHVPKGFYPLLNGGDLAVLFCFVFLYFAFAGGGAWSLDALVRKKQ